MKMAQVRKVISETTTPVTWNRLTAATQHATALRTMNCWSPLYLESLLAELALVQSDRRSSACSWCGACNGGSIATSIYTTFRNTRPSITLWSLKMHCRHSTLSSSDCLWDMPFEVETSEGSGRQLCAQSLNQPSMHASGQANRFLNIRLLCTWR